MLLVKLGVVKGLIVKLDRLWGYRRNAMGLLDGLGGVWLELAGEWCCESLAICCAVLRRKAVSCVPSVERPIPTSTAWASLTLVVCKLALLTFEWYALIKAAP